MAKRFKTYPKIQSDHVLSQGVVLLSARQNNGEFCGKKIANFFGC
jgi:hypothetical protein